MTISKSDMCNLFAEVFTYPTSDYKEKVELMTTNTCEKKSDIKFAKVFNNQTSNLLLSDIEELFTKTFDMNPDSCLDLGWHLFGEGYDRGEFLAKTREQLRKNNITEKIELPDHLSHILKLLGTQKNDQANKLVSKTIYPALLKIKPAVDEKNLFSNALLALEQFLIENYKTIEGES
tara:strand:+ start:60 stop:590 length:531 start_codon:yes stop_codon:yes gene_type:complete